MMAKIVAGIIGGLLVGACGFLLSTLALNPISRAMSANIFLGLWGFAFLTSLITSSGGKAWRFNWITSAILCILFPVSGLIFSSAESKGTQNADLGILGTAIDQMLEFPYSGSVGIFLGVLFLIFGLIAGKENTGMYIIRPDQVTAPPKRKDHEKTRFQDMEIRETDPKPSHWSKKHF